MKKKLFALLAAVCVTLTACTFFACADAADNKDGEYVTDNDKPEGDDSNDNNNENKPEGDDSNDNNNENKPEGDATIENGHKIVYAFTTDGDTMEITQKSSMYDYMCALKEDGALTFEGTMSEYGFYITSVMGVTSVTVSSTPTSYTGWDWAVYTTITELDGVSYSGEEYTTIDGVKLYKASYGASGVPCVEGESYALVYELSSMSW